MYVIRQKCPLESITAASSSVRKIANIRILHRSAQQSNLVSPRPSNPYGSLRQCGYNACNRSLALSAPLSPRSWPTPHFLVCNGGNLTSGSACQQRKVLSTFWRCVAKIITSPLFHHKFKINFSFVSSGPDLTSPTRSCPWVHAALATLAIVPLERYRATWRGMHSDDRSYHCCFSL
jgi:hypothetical protein